MQIFGYPLFLLLGYLVVGAAILMGRPTFSLVANRCGLADWFTAQSFRCWVAILWPAFLVAAAMVAVIGLIALLIAVLTSRPQPPDQAGEECDPAGASSSPG